MEIASLLLQKEKKKSQESSIITKTNNRWSSRRCQFKTISSAVSQLQRDLSFNLKLAPEISYEQFCSLINIILIRRVTYGPLKMTLRSFRRARILLCAHGLIVGGTRRDQSSWPVVEAPYAAHAGRRRAEHGSDSPAVHVEI